MKDCRSEGQFCRSFSFQGLYTYLIAIYLEERAVLAVRKEPPLDLKTKSNKVLTIVDLNKNICCEKRSWAYLISSAYLS